MNTIDDKAKELVEKFMNVMPTISPIPRTSDMRRSADKVKYIMDETAKQSALICVDEIIDFLIEDDKKHECCSWCNSTEMTRLYKIKEKIQSL